MKFVGATIIVVSILFAVGLRLAEPQQEVSFAPEPDEKVWAYDQSIKFVEGQSECAIVVVERNGETPTRVTVDLECYGRRKVVIKEEQ